MAAALGYLMIGGLAALAPLGSDGAPRDLVSAAAQSRRTVRRMHDDSPVGTLPLDTLSIERKVIVRIPVHARPEPLFRQSRSSRAARQPSCLPLRAIRGASLERKGILFLTATGGRYLGVLERSCRTTDFQSGFYLNPAPDAALCVGRDVLHARSGLSCLLTRFSRTP